MPTFDTTRRFERDHAGLRPQQKAQFRTAVEKLIEDLPAKRFRKGLRVKGVQGADGIFEMTWADDGRATFQYGESIREGEPHVVWRRVGTHGILDDP